MPDKLGQNVGLTNLITSCMYPKNDNNIDENFEFDSIARALLLQMTNKF